MKDNGGLILHETLFLPYMWYCLSDYKIYIKISRLYYLYFTKSWRKKEKNKRKKNYIILCYFCHIIVNLISENGKTKKIENKLKSRDVCVNQCVLYKFPYNKLFWNQIHVVVISIMMYHNRNYKELSPLCIA